MDENNIGSMRVEIDNIKSDITELKDKSNQHDKDIINLKESNIELKIYVKQIFEKIDEVKSMIQTKKDDTKKENEDKMDKFIDVILTTFQNSINSENEIKKEEVKANTEVKINTNKQKWIIIGSIITALSSILLAIFK